MPHEPHQPQEHHERPVHTPGPQPAENASVESAETASDPRPRIYVASLSDYNHGILHGTWIDAHAQADEIWPAIHDMLRTSPTTRRFGEPAEEWAIHDSDGFGPHIRIGEYTDINTVSQLARALVEHGDAYGAWTTIADHDERLDLDAFADRYVGEYDSVVDFAREMLADLGMDIVHIDSIPDSLKPYVHVDWEGLARDMELGGDITTVHSAHGVHIFHN